MNPRTLDVVQIIPTHRHQTSIRSKCIRSRSKFSKDKFSFSSSTLCAFARLVSSGFFGCPSSTRFDEFEGEDRRPSPALARGVVFCCQDLLKLLSEDALLLSRFEFLFANVSCIFFMLCSVSALVESGISVSHIVLLPLPSSVASIGSLPSVGSGSFLDSFRPSDCTVTIFKLLSGWLFACSASTSCLWIASSIWTEITLSSLPILPADEKSRLASFSADLRSVLFRFISINSIVSRCWILLNISLALW
mmetsp:Transcript_5281/g.10483  ORF Transcript_5281/g.10483 Transcript_5281/m.10483 type:complete len:249 (+) Transcript_5281:493-1239(+)